jgi:hypothetical protein
MSSSDTGALGELLADDFALTHLSGYAQPKNEWLTQLRAGALTAAAALLAVAQVAVLALIALRGRTRPSQLPALEAQATRASASGPGASSAGTPRLPHRPGP